MIKNIIFDIGNVLLEFKPGKYIYELGFTGDDAEALSNAVFSHKSWIELDRGTLTEEEAIERMVADSPRHEANIRKALNPKWLDMLTPIEPSIAFMRELKAEGYKIYILSNYHSRSFDYIYNKYDFFTLIDGMVISSHVRRIKPEPEIYSLLLDKYGLTPAESVFFDDLPVNVEAARKLGIRGIVYTDAETARRGLKLEMDALLK